MKKIFILLFIFCGVFAYSNTKCEAKAKYAAEFMTQNLKEQGLNAKYKFLGANKDFPNLYLYEIAMTQDGQTAYMYVASDISDGTVYAKEGDDANTDFQPIATGVKEIMCKN